MRSKSKQSEKLLEALDELAKLLPYGELLLATDSSEFIRAAVYEINRLRSALAAKESQETAPAQIGQPTKQTGEVQ